DDSVYAKARGGLVRTRQRDRRTDPQTWENSEKGTPQRSRRFLTHPTELDTSTTFIKITEAQLVRVGPLCLCFHRFALLRRQFLTTPYEHDCSKNSETKRRILWQSC